MPNVGDVTSIEFVVKEVTSDGHLRIAPPDPRILIWEQVDALYLHETDIDRYEWKAPPPPPLPTKLGSMITATVGGHKDVWLILVSSNVNPDGVWRVIDQPQGTIRNWWLNSDITEWAPR